MKTKTNFLTKLLAVFAVVFLCLGFSTMALTGQDKAIAEEPSSTVTANIKDGGFMGNMFNIYDATVKWGNTAGANSVFSYSKGYSVQNGYTLDVTVTTSMSDKQLTNLIWYDSGNKHYWQAGRTYNISYDYKITRQEGSEGNISFGVQVDGNWAKLTTNNINGDDGWIAATHKFSVADDYTYASNKNNDFRITFSNFIKDDKIQIKNIKVEVESNCVVNGEVCNDGNLTGSSNHVIFTKVEQEGEDSYYDIVGTGTSGNFTPTTSRIAWCAGRTYELSFYLKTVNTNATPSWCLYARAFVNNTANELDYRSNNTNYKSIALGGKIGEWTKYTYKFTPTANASYNITGNYFGFVIFLGKDENIQIKDVTVKMSTDGLKDDVVSNSKMVNGRGSTDTVISVCNSNNENAYIDSVYGKVNTITWNNVIDGNRSVWDDKVTEWVDGVTYTVYFKVKTSAIFTANVQVDVNIAGHSNVNICSTAEVINGSPQTEWKTICKSFTVTDLNKGTENASQTKNIFRFLLTNGAGYGENEENKQVLYYTDVKIYANVSTVTLSNGTNTSENVVTGSEYTLTTPTMDAGKAFVGWDLDGTLYKAGDKITVSADTTLTAVSVDFATDSGAYLRLDLENTGVRFTATADKTAIEDALAKYGTVTEFGMRITAEKKEGYLDIKTNKWLQDGKAFASAITGFSEDNKEFYGVKFTAKAYLKLKLANDEVITVYANSSAADKSIVEMADTAYRKRKDTQEGEYTNYVENDSYDSTLNGTYSMYSDEELAILREFASANTNS